MHLKDLLGSVVRVGFCIPFPDFHLVLYGLCCRKSTIMDLTNCLKGRVVCGTVYGEMHLKDLLGSFVRVGYCIPFPDFYLVLHGLCCRNSTIMDLTNCLKGRVVCGTVYGEMHLKDLLGSFARVGYCIPFPDFYLVLHGLCCRNSTIMDLTNCLKGRVVCGTVYGEMHLKDLLGSFIRVGFCISFLDFHLMLYGLCCRKSTIMDLTKPNHDLPRGPDTETEP